MNKKQKLDYRTPQKIDKKQVIKFLSQKGYKILSLTQDWRHLCGKLEKNNHLFFLKMASTKDIGKRTQNEAVWNKQITTILDKRNISFFTVPKIFQTGLFKNKFYYISECFLNSLILSKKQKPSLQIHKWLDQIIEINLFFLSLPINIVNLPRDKEFKNFSEQKNHYLEKIKDWHKESKKYQLSEVYKIAKTLYKNYQPSINHSDFVPWHMIKNKDQIILIDAEHASAKNPKYYDVCYFFHRLYTSAQNPEMAKLYLKKLQNKLSKKEKNDFWQLTMPVLASRILGGFWDIIQDKNENIKYHQMLKKEFLKNKVFQNEQKAN